MRTLSPVKTLLNGAALALSFAVSGTALAQSEEVTFHKDIEPILQRSCQNCHRDGGAGL